MRILLVEDERKIASFIARTLRENAYLVDIAETGEKALALGSDVSYDVITKPSTLCSTRVRAVSIIRGASTPRWRNSRQTSSPLIPGNLTSISDQAFCAGRASGACQGTGAPGLSQ